MTAVRLLSRNQGGTNLAGSPRKAGIFCESPRNPDARDGMDSKRCQVLGGTMLKLLRLLVVLAGATVLALLVAPVANSAERTTFVVPLSAESECPEAVASGATGNAVIHVDAETGEIKYRVVADDNLTGDR